jgi:ATP/maltotriose-dependent transcriptional regulator MalT
MLVQAALRDIDSAAEPVRAALMLRTRGHLKFSLGRKDYAGDLEEAVRLVPADPPSPARARVLEALAQRAVKVHGGRVNPTLRWAAEEAVTAARQSGDDATEAAALITLACAEPISAGVERIRAMLAQARSIASRAGAFQPLLSAAIAESDLLEGAGLHELAAGVAREGLEAAREYGLGRTFGGVLANNVVEPLVSLGRWDEAGEIIERSLRLFPPRLNRTCIWRLAGDIALARGDLRAAAESVASIRAVTEDARYDAQYHLSAIRLDTELRLAQRRPAEALSAVGNALDCYDMRPSPRYAWPLLVAGLRACAAAAREAALSARAAPRARRAGAAARSPAAERRHHPARPAGQDLARAGQRRGHPRARAGPAGADGAGVRGSAAGRGRAQQPRDRRRAVHLGKTASVHVSNILAKLGVTSRGEAAAAAHRLRLFDSFPAGGRGLREPPHGRHRPAPLLLVSVRGRHTPVAPCYPACCPFPLRQPGGPAFARNAG